MGLVKAGGRVWRRGAAGEGGGRRDKRLQRRLWSVLATVSRRASLLNTEDSRSRSLCEGGQAVRLDGLHTTVLATSTDEYLCSVS
jgi:hypothetical protein